MTVLRLQANIVGRDFAVGDIHGCFSVLEKALEEASFDTSKDRLFCVGDLINRGTESERSLEFLEKEWFYTVRGNHEHMFQEDVALMNAKGKDVVKDHFDQAGLGWILSLSEEDQNTFIQAFDNLPYAIEVLTKEGGIIGITHAEVPENCSWQDFTQKLEEGDKRTLKNAILGRSRITKAYKNGYDTDAGVSGVSKLFTGHSIATGRKASKMGNWFCIDTGAVMRYRGTEGMFPESPAEDMHLTLVDIGATEVDVLKPRADTKPYHVIARDKGHKSGF